MAFQGMLREALYTKCINRSGRYRDMDLQELTEQMVNLFCDAVGYEGPVK